MSNLNESTGRALRELSQGLAEAIVARQYNLRPQEWQAFGATGREKSVRDAGYHLAYLSEAIAANAPALFADYVAWVKVLFAGLGFTPDAVEKTLASMRQVLDEQLTPDMAALAADYITVGMAALKEAPLKPPLFVNPALPLGGLAKEYLDALVRADRRTANRLILDALARGISVAEIYLHVFQRTQYEIGRLWQINELTVAQEHFCTAATQFIMSQLYPYIFTTERVNRRMVATCVGGELHEIGVRMVADFFEMAGWDTYYLGANMPTASILQTLAERHAQLLCLSATITFHVSEVADLIAQVRASGVGEQVKILVGGYPFNVSENLWQAVNADGFARDAQEAVRVGNGLVGA